VWSPAARNSRCLVERDRAWARSAILSQLGEHGVSALLPTTDTI
jgi:hypothetical protein